ncbi:DNA replication regulator SLD3, partial [Lecanoromycetidae sp. Uapishka_2]
MIRSQYQEALYASKASLAYFAKGPLSRARAAFHSYDDAGHSQSQLAQFLRTSILALPTMDIKYRETLPGLLKGLPFRTLSDDEGEHVIAATGKNIRKSKKMKIGKNGLYSGEELNVARWWLSRDTVLMACDTAEAQEEGTRVVLLEQRAKETQMQIILVLETLALEVSDRAVSLERDPPQHFAQPDEVSQKKIKKTKKQQDLVTLLDLLADRLSIWQSMSVDEGNTANKEKRPTSQAGAKATDAGSGSDQLRQFCIDVILPL